MKNFKRTISLVLGMIVVICSAFSVAPVSAAAISDAVIENLTTDYAVNPLGIDNETPVFGWTMQSNLRGQCQTAYKIGVASSKEKAEKGDFDFWDSGKTVSCKSVAISYEGKTLAAATRYYWQVTVWDKDGKTATSDIAYFETGLMNQGWSDAKFIGKQPSGGFMYTSFTIEMDLLIHSGSASVGFGGNNKSNYYMWQINSWNNQYVYLRPHKIENGNYKTIEEVNISDDIGYTSSQLLGNTIHLKIVSENGVIKTYFGNRTEPSAVTDLGGPVNLGRIIFRGYSSAKVTEKATYDNIVIKDGVGNVIFTEDFENDESGTFNTTDALVIADGGYTVGAPSDTGREYFGIMSDSATSLGEAAPMLRKEFTLTKEIDSARLYATAAGAYNFYINGNKVGDEYLAPGRTEYTAYTLYQTYDVTRYLKVGDNAAGALLGHGWYNRARGEYGDNLALMAKIVVKFKDGTTNTVITDGSWKFSVHGPLLDDDIYNGDKYDARRELTGFDTAEFTPDSSWLSVTTYEKSSLNLGDIISLPAEGIKIVKTLPAVAVTEPEKGVYIYDFGQNFAGVVEFTATAPEGTVIKLRHGEVLNQDLDGKGSGMDGAEGTLYTENLYTNNKQMRAEATDYYTFKGDPDGETYSPLMTQHGFRYVEITGISSPLPLSAVKGLVMSSAMEDTGEFETSNDRVNRLYQNALWSKLSNFISVPIDCPQRSERMGWTGDAQIFTRTATYMSNCNNFFKKYLKDLFAAQKPNGAILDAVPNGWINATGNAANGWGDAAVIIPWQLYAQYGDTSVIEDYFDNMCRYVDHLVATSQGYIRNNGPYGDWMNTGQSTDLAIVETAYSAYVSNLLSQMAAVIGRDAEAKVYKAHFEGYRNAWRTAYIEADGSLTNETQTAYVLGIQFGLFDENEIPDAANRLVGLIEANGNKLSGGFLGLPFINPALSKAGKDETAYTLLEQDAHPSWLRPVDMGATTIWEAFYVMNPWTGMVALSHNHYAYGSIAEWMYTNVLGIQRDETNADTVAYKKIVLKPSMGGTITYAKGSYKSVMGKIYSAWNRNNNGYTYTAVIPANTTATLYLPISDGMTAYEGGISANNAEGVTYLKTENGDAVYQLASGTYNFTVLKDGITTEQKVELGFENLGVAIRSEGVQGIRFKTRISQGLIKNGVDGYKVSEYGTVAIKTKILNGKELTLDGSYNYGKKTYTPATGIAYVSGQKDNFFVRDAAELVFTGVLTNITEEEYEDNYTVRGYLIFEDKKGNKKTVYTAPVTTSTFAVAETAYSFVETTGAYRESQEVRKYLFEKVLNVVDPEKYKTFS